ncbi:MBL fold metallo-hydrolase [Halobacillus sp. B23F22_1]|uniref:MBL fold metallo-hydrolase n=1 Tax=Halobacillus sp. B23F22_1 TaxID=3459514 RepID=UPI00373EA9F6
MGEITVQRFITGTLRSNCFVVTLDEGCVVIDPGECVEDVVSYIGDREIHYILLTHGHYDHIAGVKRLKRYTTAFVGIHQLEAKWLLEPRLNRSSNTGAPVYGEWPDILFTGEEVVQCDPMKIKVLYTPGHSPGGVSYLISDECVFTGDSLLAGFIGPTNLPYSDRPMLKRSIRERLFTLPEKVVVYPGHGPKTTIGFEKKNNTFPNVMELLIQ